MHTVTEFDHKGAKVAVFPMDGVETLKVYVILNAGSYHELGKDWGAMHLLEHLSFDGTKKLPTNHEIATYREEYGMHFSGSTSAQTTSYALSFPAVSLKESFIFLKEVLFNSLIEDRSIDLERKVIQQEHIDKWSKPTARYWQARVKQLFGDNHPYIRDGMGQPDYIRSLSQADLRSLYNQFYVPSNLSIGIAGRIDEGKARVMIDKMLKNISRGSTAQVNIPKISPGKKYMYHKEDVDNVSIDVSFHTPGRQDLSMKDKLALGIARYILGGSVNSLLARELRLNRGLVYECYASKHTLPTCGEFSLHASVSSENVEKVYAQLWKIVNDFTKNGVDDNLYIRAAKFMNLRTLMIYDSVSNIAEDIAWSLYLHGRVYTPEEMVSIANTIDQAYVLNLIKPILTKDNEYLSVMARSDPFGA